MTSMFLRSVPLLLAALSSSVSAFGAFTRTSTSSSTRAFSSTALFGSRRVEKQLARQAWAAERGYGDGVSDDDDDVVAAGLWKNDDGLEFVRLVHPETGESSEIYLYGGVVTSYISGGIEHIAVRPDAKMDGSKPISGGLSHCWPQFGPGEIQQHGFARNVEWSIVEQSDTSVELEMLPSDYTEEMWPKKFRCGFTVEVTGDSLSTTLKVDNNDEADFDFQAALHSYFTCSSLPNLSIEGSFEGKEFLNKLAGDGGEMQTEDRAALVIDEEYDRVYTGVNDPALVDTGKGTKLSVLNTAGWADTVVWNPYGNEGMGYDNFVCVESVKYDPVTLPAGESWTAVMSLQATPLEAAEPAEAVEAEVVA